MSEPMRQGKSFVPPKGVAVLMGDPLPELTAKDFADGLDDSLSDHDLAEAIALISNKVGHLMHLVEEGEASMSGSSLRTSSAKRHLSVAVPSREKALV